MKVLKIQSQNEIERIMIKSEENKQEIELLKEQLIKKKSEVNQL